MGVWTIDQQRFRWCARNGERFCICRVRSSITSPGLLDATESQGLET